MLVAMPTPEPLRPLKIINFKLIQKPIQKIQNHSYEQLQINLKLIICRASKNVILQVFLVVNAMFQK